MLLAKKRDAFAASQQNVIPIRIGVHKAHKGVRTEVAFSKVSEHLPSVIEKPYCLLGLSLGRLWLGVYPSALTSGATVYVGKCRKAGGQRPCMQKIRPIYIGRNFVYCIVMQAFYRAIALILVY